MVLWVICAMCTVPRSSVWGRWGEEEGGRWWLVSSKITLCLCLGCNKTCWRFGFLVEDVSEQQPGKRTSFGPRPRIGSRWLFSLCFLRKGLGW
ncbi:hypothetical protein CC80DRAFT_222740 [Byssothecium circinans]|uniref:Uncharacterized protein n=1 Tax=Byssothecium circinans TaxID=147558 RepID=A0A6A5TEP4_9PLEO|nr:hypothetical protein CC80DRAFT_222740 [Byssothecium circinans]